MCIPIITLNWNGIQDTEMCMNALFQQTHQDFIIHLVDNGSNLENVTRLKQLYSNHPQIILHLNKENLGFTKGNNEILRQLLKEDYSHIILLNNDTEVAPDWLENLYQAAIDTQAGMVTSKMINYFKPDQMDNAGHLMLNTAEIIPIGHAESVDLFQKRTSNIGACAGAAIYRTDMLRAIGIFDEYFETGYEDAELGVRANILGYDTIFEPTAVVKHKVKQSIKKILNYEYILKIQLNIFYAYFKLMPFWVLLLNLPSFLFKYGSIIIIDIVFIRPKFLKIMLDAWYRTIFKNRKTILAARRTFYKKHRPISSWKILQKMQFFLWFDIKRFWKYIILRKETELEQY